MVRSGTKKTETKNSDVRHRSAKALLIVDMLNRFEFPRGARLANSARRAARRIAGLKARAKKKKIPVIYVNDNFGQWKSDRQAIFENAGAEESRGREIARRLAPEDDDYFVLKPKHSAFFSTSLDVLLNQMGARELIFTGVAADICILFSVHDAHIRDYRITVPQDCVSSESNADKKHALALMRKAFKIKATSAERIRF